MARVGLTVTRLVGPTGSTPWSAPGGTAPRTPTSWERGLDALHVALTHWPRAKEHV